MAPQPEYPPNYPAPYPATGQPGGPPPKLNQVPWILGGIGGVFALALVALLAFVAIRGLGGNNGPGGGDKQAKERAGVAAEALVDAAREMAAAPAVRTSGTLLDDEGQPLTVDAQTTSEGSTFGTVTVRGERVELLITRERTFVKAGEGYWDDEGVPADSLAAYSKDWVRVTEDVFGEELAKLLSPSGLGDLFDLPGSQLDPAAFGPVVTIDGIEVRGVDIGEFTAWVTTAKPNRIVRVTTAPPPGSTPSPGARPAPSGSAGPPGSGDVDLTVQQLGPGEAEALFVLLQQRVRSLTTALDSQVRFGLGGTITFKPCGTTSCRANVTLRNSVSPGNPLLSSGTINAAIAIRMTLDNKALKTCNTVKAMKPNGTITVTCDAKFYIPPSTNPKTHYVRAYATAVARAVAAADINAMVDELAAERTRTRTKQENPQPTPS